MSARLLTVALLLCPLPLQAQQTDTPDPELPGLELLEFIADFGDLDEQTLELLEYHARRDLQQRNAETRQPDNRRGEETSDENP